MPSATVVLRDDINLEEDDYDDDDEDWVDTADLMATPSIDIRKPSRSFRLPSLASQEIQFSSDSARQRAFVPRTDLEADAMKQRKAIAWTEEVARRVMKYNFTLATWKIAFLAGVWTKREMFMSAVHHVMAFGIKCDEERTRLLLEFVHTRSQLTRAIRAVELSHDNDTRHFVRFVNARQARKSRLILEDEEMMHRDNIVDDRDAWELWSFVDAAVLHKRAAFEAALHEMVTLTFDRMAFTLAESRCRAAAESWQSGFVRPILFSKFVLADFNVHAQADMLRCFIDTVSHSPLHQLVTSHELLVRVSRGHHVRSLLRKQHAVVMVDRTRIRACKTMHRVVIAWFIRKALRSLRQRKKAIESSARRLLRRVFRGYAARSRLGTDANEKYEWVRSLIHHKKLLMLESEADARLAILREEHTRFMQILGGCSGDMSIRVTIIHRIVRGFVSRVDLGLFRRFNGRNPLDRVSKSAGHRRFAQSLAWHEMAANHNLWHGLLCDAM